jgi:hypothetical protein
MTDLQAKLWTMISGSQSEAYDFVMKKLTNGNPSGDFKHSTIGADDRMRGFQEGYAQAARDILTYLNYRES